MTSTSLKTHPTKLIKHQQDSDVFERRLECQFGNCEDLEVRKDNVGRFEKALTEMFNVGDCLDRVFALGS